MPTPRIELDINAVYAALEEHGGNKTLAARALGIHRQTLRQIMVENGIKPLTAGRVRQLPANQLPLPPPGKIACYLLTSAQNNTSIYKKFLASLAGYKKHLEDSGRETRLMISRFTYNKTAYENSWMGKPGNGPTDFDHHQCWYDPAIAPYICDDPDQHGSCRWQLAPGLQWCAESNIIPTNASPFGGRDAYNGMDSGIFPHAKMAMKSLPRMPGEHPRFQYTTGCCTQLNYIQRNAGQKAEFHHVYGAVIVEVNSDGDWWVRQLNADSTGGFYDCPNGEVVRVQPDGTVTTEHRALAINWGDIHASEIDPDVRTINWGQPGGTGCAIDALRPKYQLMHDLHSQRSANHHDKAFSVRYKKWLNGQDIVVDEVQCTRELLWQAQRDFCETIVVSSNHDRHGDRWLDECDFRHDLPNAEFFLEAQLAHVRAMKADDEHWTFLEWALKASDWPRTRFLRMGESFPIGPKNHQIECGLHGDNGPSGAKGSTRNLATLGRRNNKGHDHQATIFEGTWSAGACQLEFGYSKGKPTKSSISHIITWLNGKRCMLTQRVGKLWA